MVAAVLGEHGDLAHSSTPSLGTSAVVRRETGPGRAATPMMQ